jgi:hypothetical protein
MIVSRISVNQWHPLVLQFKYYSLRLESFRISATTDFIFERDTMRLKSAVSAYFSILYRYVSQVFRVITVRREPCLDVFAFFYLVALDW